MNRRTLCLDTDAQQENARRADRFAMCWYRKPVHQAKAQGWQKGMNIEDIKPSDVEHRAKKYKKATVKADLAMVREVPDSSMEDDFLPETPRRTSGSTIWPSPVRELLHSPRTDFLYPEAIPTSTELREECLTCC